jgi:PBP1b-binding outer membrane lipoprotein LpoB
MRIVLVVIAGALVLAGCSSKVKGTYTDKMGATSYAFDGNDKVLISTGFGRVEFDYEQEDDKIRINTPEGTMVLLLLEDGSIDGPVAKLYKSDEKKE